MSVVINPTVATVGRSVTARYFGTGDGSRVLFNLAGLDSDRAYLMPVLYLDQTLQTVTTHYSVDATGKVTFVTAPAAGKVVNYKDPHAPSGNIYRAFGMGDGTSVDFSLPFVPKTPLLYRNDWQGNQLLYSTARTNLVSESQTLGTLPWSGTGVSGANATGIAPDGTNTGCTLTVTTASHSFRQLITVVPGTVYDFSFWAKLGSLTDIKYSIYDNTNGVWINLYVDYSAQVGVGWARVHFPFTAPALCTSIGVYPLHGTTGTGTMDYWGAQVEAGSSATPYIPTTTAAVTVTDYTYTPSGAVTLAVAPVVGALLTGDFNMGPTP